MIEIVKIKEMILNSEPVSSILEDSLFQNLRTIIINNRNLVQQGGQKLKFLPNMQSCEYQNFISSQYQMISRQTEFLEQIKQQIKKKNNNSNHNVMYCGRSENNINILSMQSSFDMSNISSVQGTEEQPFKTKFGWQFQKSLMISALSQVHQNCSAQTFQTMKGYVNNNKQKDYQILSQKFQKLSKLNQQLQTSFIIKSANFGQVQIQLKEALQKIQSIEQQKKKIKVKQNQLSEKQMRIFKLENSIVFKQKLFHQGKKRYQREKNLFLSIQARLANLYTDMYSLWEEIINKMQQAQKLGCIVNCQTWQQDKGSCWKKQVMIKCKQQLIDQRNLLRQQQQQIQKQFDMIQALSQQVKKLANQKQPIINIDPFWVQPSPMIYNAKSYK